MHCGESADRIVLCLISTLRINSDMKSLRKREPSSADALKIGEEYEKKKRFSRWAVVVKDAGIPDVFERSIFITKTRIKRNQESQNYYAEPNGNAC